MGGAAIQIRPSPAQNEFRQVGMGPALNQISFTPICKVLSFTDIKEIIRAKS